MKTRDSDDDVLLQAISAATQQRRAWNCLDMSASCYSVSVWPAHSLWNGLQNSNSEKNPNIKQSCRPEPHAETMWAALENNSTYKNRRGSAVVPPPVDRNLRSRQECARALPRLISEQISIRRQVWSAYPHSCSCLRLYYYVQEPFTMWRVVKLECWHNKTLRKFCPRTLFNNTSWETHAVVRVVLCFLYRNSPKSPLLIWFQNSTSFAFGTRESLSTLWVPFVLLFEREEWDHCGPKAQSVRFRWLFR